MALFTKKVSLVSELMVAAVPTGPACSQICRLETAELHSYPISFFNCRIVLRSESLLGDEPTNVFVVALQLCL